VPQKAHIGEFPSVAPHLHLQRLTIHPAPFTPAQQRIPTLSWFASGTAFKSPPRPLATRVRVPPKTRLCDYCSPGMASLDVIALRQSFLFTIGAECNADVCTYE